MHRQKLRLTKIETSQEARRLVVAEYQHIVYREWLPIVLGNNFMRVYGLNPLSEVGHDRTFKSAQVLPKSYIFYCHVLLLVNSNQYHLLRFQCHTST